MLRKTHWGAVCHIRDHISWQRTSTFSFYVWICNWFSWVLKDKNEEGRLSKMGFEIICYIFDISIKRIFLDTMSSQTRETIERISKWDFIRLKSFFKATANRIETERQPTNWEKIFASNTSDKGLISIIHKELSQLNNKKLTPSKSGQETWTDIFPKKIYRWPIGTWKDVHHRWSSGKCKSKLH